MFEVYPEIKLGDLKDVEIERSVLEVGTAELDNTLEVLRKQRVTYEPVDRAAMKGDRVTIDFLGKRTVNRSRVVKRLTIRSCSAKARCWLILKRP